MRRYPTRPRNAPIQRPVGLGEFTVRKPVQNKPRDALTAVFIGETVGGAGGNRSRIYL